MISITRDSSSWYCCRSAATFLVQWRILSMHKPIVFHMSSPKPTWTQNRAGHYSFSFPVWMENSRLWLVLGDYEKEVRINHIKGYRSSQCGCQCTFKFWKDNFYRTGGKGERIGEMRPSGDCLCWGQVAEALKYHLETHWELSWEIPESRVRDVTFCVKTAKRLSPFPSRFRGICYLNYKWWC